MESSGKECVKSSHLDEDAFGDFSLALELSNRRGLFIKNQKYGECTFKDYLASEWWQHHTVKRSNHTKPCEQCYYHFEVGDRYFLHIAVGNIKWCECCVVDHVLAVEFPQTRSLAKLRSCRSQLTKILEVLRNKQGPLSDIEMQNLRIKFKRGSAAHSQSSNGVSSSIVSVP